jgi:hypothetical protein
MTSVVFGVLKKDKQWSSNKPQPKGIIAAKLKMSSCMTSLLLG